MTDIASLGIVVNTKGVKEAKDGLDGLTETGRKSERAAKDLSKTWEQLSFSPKQLFAANRSLGQYKLNLADVAKQAAETAKASQKVSAAAQPFDRAVRGTTLSTKQLVAATRGLPAQFTDIATSLAAGQNPMQVLLQQGGQLKDMFGGIGPAVRAVGGYIGGMINPVTLAAAAVGTLGYAWFRASEEAVAFNQAMILTGNNAGVSAAALADVARELDKTTTATQGFASEVLAQVASTGRFTAQEMEAVTRAAIQMEAATGRAIEDTVKEFIALKNDPVEAILKLNEAQHFLTEETLKSIQELKKQGKEADAATVAVRAYADTINSRAPAVLENLGLFSGAWHDVKNGAREAWDEIIQGFRDADREAKQGLQSIKDYFTAFNFSGPAGFFAFGQAGSTNSAPPPATGTTSKTPIVDTARARAAMEFDKDALRFATQRQRMEADIAEARATGLKAGKSELEIEKRVAAIRASYATKGPKPRKERAKEDPAEGILARIRQQIALNQEELNSQDKLTSSDRLRITIQQQLLELKGKVTGARKAEIESVLKELAASDDLLQAKIEETRLNDDLLRLTNQLMAAEENRRRANEIQLLALSGIGREEVERQQRRLDIEREYQDGLRQLRDRGVAEDSESYKRQEAELRASRDRMLLTEQEYQRKRSELMADWQNGARAAIQDFMDETANVAGQTYDIFSSAMDGLTQVFTDFFTKGKADWKGFFNDLAAQITAFVVKQQLAKALAKLLPGGEEGQGSQAQALSRSAGELAASAAPLMAAAAALTGAATALAAAGAASAVSGASGGSTAGATSGGGMNWGGFISSIFSAWGGGRANGGPVSRGKLYEVGERGPEILSMHGRNWLIPGANGYVTPNAANDDRGGVVLNQTFVVQGTPDSRTREQMARMSGREAARGMNRTGR